ncbi:MAG: 4Fe-4S binding protein [Oscillospiraceae bacterium]|nr:4Fe-4S binding protein [Oscillospiraceae bacterium]
MPQQTIYTITANCQDCYRCVRECPVKAIRITGGQARVEDALCIKCGTCVRECPQHAKTVRSDLDEVRALIGGGRLAAASVAPSFAALFPGALSRRLPSALRQLGFRFVGETAEGAKYVTDQSFAVPRESGVCTACPAVVNYVEKYRPEHLDALIPVVSPMIAHGRMIKANRSGYAVIFIGPCAAKKQEILRPENTDAVDAVLTFAELSEWLLSENIQLENCSESSFDRFYEIGDARLFPLQGGMLKTGGIRSGGTEAGTLHISGAEDVMGLFSDAWNFEDTLIEPLFCKGGCIGGPCFAGEEASKADQSLFARRENVIRYAREAKKDDGVSPANEIFHRPDFVRDEQSLEEVSENQIHKILELTGKIDPVYQLNCGACGYKSCLENAVAVARGMAEPEMCIPYMRRLAQQRTDRIIDTTPNGVVILDSELCMIQMNPAFQKMFTCNNGILGRRISYLVNADGFERLQSGAEEQYESIQTKYGIRYHEILYPLREERQYVGIYSDISKIKYDSKQLDTIRAQTLMHAREFLDHQVRFAQEMAHYLGKSTAQSEEIAMRLIGLYEDEDDGGETP